MGKELGCHIDVDNLYGKIVREVQDASTDLFQPLINKEIAGSRRQDVAVENIGHGHKGKYRNHYQYTGNTHQCPSEHLQVVPKSLFPFIVLSILLFHVVFLHSFSYPFPSFVIQSEAKDLGNIYFMLPRFFTTLRSVLNDNTSYLV